MAGTPTQKWNAAISRYKDKCRRIVESSESVRYAGVMNEFGRTLTGALRPGVRPMLNTEQARDEFFIISTLMTLRKTQSEPLGQLDYVILRHGKVFIVAYRKNRSTFYVSIDRRERRLEELVTSIRDMI